MTEISAVRAGSVAVKNHAAVIAARDTDCVMNDAFDYRNTIGSIDSNSHERFPDLQAPENEIGELVDSDRMPGAVITFDNRPGRVRVGDKYDRVIVAAAAYWN